MMIVSVSVTWFDDEGDLSVFTVGEEGQMNEAQSSLVKALIGVAEMECVENERRVMLRRISREQQVWADEHVVAPV